MVSTALKNFFVQLGSFAISNPGNCATLVAIGFGLGALLV